MVFQTPQGVVLNIFTPVSKNECPPVDELQHNLAFDIGSTMKASFIVTGFGPFHGVKVNPTSVIVEKLPEYLHDNGRDDRSTTQTLVLETSAAGAKEQMDSLYDALCPTNRNTDEDPRILVLIHLGVHSTAKNYHIESCAYNEADFCVPDEAGDQPRNSPILSHCTLGTPLSTLMNVPNLVEKLNVLRCGKPKTTETLLPAAVSTNPGRFVCNYTYCYSLDKFQCSSLNKDGIASNPVRCLFVHVPSFEVAPEKEQLQFIVDLMDAMEQQLQNGD